MEKNVSTNSDIRSQLIEAIRSGSSNARAAVEIEGACGGKCPQCYAVWFKNQPQTTPEKFDQTLLVLEDLGFKETYIVGGEPMLHKDALKICTKVKEKGLAAILVTTGYSLDDPQKAEEALKSTDQIEISIRSVHPAVHNNVVGGVGWINEESEQKPKMGSFEQAIGALKTLTEVRDRLGLKTRLAINHDLYDNQEVFEGRSMVWAIAKKLHDEGIKLDGFYLQLIDYSGRAKENVGLMDTIQIKKQDFLRSLEDLNRIKDKFDISDVGVTDDPVRLGILSENEIPGHLKSLIAGEVVPAISPAGMVRKNVVEE
jgi:MoaA/NifB/PqqE/SkfB family radical SAM enzyme